MKNLQTILANIAKDKHLTKFIESEEYYSAEDFIKDAQAYIKAIKDKRMLCTIESVSASGMSRVLKFNSCEKNKNTKEYYFRQYSFLFLGLGYTQQKNSYGFRVNGCGMDMVFHTNYTNIHTFKRLGLLTDKECSKLAQMTPTYL